ncbi:MAG: transglutaminase domain-containing protein [Candidatus Eisenbacteria bacterium]|nr:transglutaminase domain-containing protein [Candidatus Eisenbacteria bacterium]
MRRLLIVALFFVLGDAGLLGVLKSNGYALRLVHADTSGAAFEAPPDAAMTARRAGLAIDYAMGMDAARAARLGLPAATRGDSGLDDMRANVRWVRAHFRPGGFYIKRPWRLEEALEAARDPDRRFYCFSHAAAMVSLCEGQGYAARIVSLSGHITSETYLPALGRWVIADAIHAVIPYDAAGRPLSAVGLHRMMLRGEPFEWRRVPDVAGAGPEMFNPGAVDTLMLRGDFVVNDGPSTFDLRGPVQRAFDLLTGRPRIIQLAAEGQPPIDRAARRIRLALGVWNLLGLLTLAAAARRAAPAPQPMTAGAAAGR